MVSPGSGLRSSIKNAGGPRGILVSLEPKSFFQERVSYAGKKVIHSSLRKLFIPDYDRNKIRSEVSMALVSYTTPAAA